MEAAFDRLEFAPPPQPGLVRAFVLAVIAHLLLMLALTWGINWNRESQNAAAEAELWSSVPRQAAPPEVQPPAPAPAPPPPAPRVVPAPPPPPAPREADIALEREKLKQQQAQRKQEELERQKKLEARKQREELERQKKLEARKKEEALKQQQVAEQKAADEKLKQKQKKEELAKAKAKQEEAKVALLRKENLDRMKGLAGAQGSSASKGEAVRSAGPSDSYAGRIRARVKPNIVFTDDVAGNPMAEVEVHMAPDGTITSRRLVKSSGVKSWDEAVLRAVDKTEVLPRDVDGRVHSPLLIEFKPKG
ncbi:MAG TPA: cell envelope integrity protein TolA [Ramlibacter sp.]|nr:cell envelope integrity protein TolA [Ramlibacter sp.]